MGAINSKKISEKLQCSRSMPRKDQSQYTQLRTNRKLVSATCDQKTKRKFLPPLCHQEAQSRKRKVLILGLGGVGKTDFYSRLVRNYNHTVKLDNLPRPTVGYNVETIKIRSHNRCIRRTHKFTLWDCGGEKPDQSLWPYHYSNTSLLVWMVNAYDRLRLDASLHLLSQILMNPMLYRVPVLIVLYHSHSDQYYQDQSNDEFSQNLLTNLEVSLRFLATISSSRASTFQWQVINISVDDKSRPDFKKIEQSFCNLMNL